jgi:hypothetical protein
LIAVTLGSLPLLLAVDLDAMTAELLAIVHQTLQPAEVSLWLRSGAAASQHSS